jgi:hypothetical protein
LAGGKIDVPDETLTGLKSGQLMILREAVTGFRIGTKIAASDGRGV